MNPHAAPIKSSCLFTQLRDHLSSAAALVLLSGAVAPVLAAEDARDFSGVWQAFASEPAISRGAEGSLSPAGQARVDEYLAQYPTMIEPGSYCVPPGMPSTMTSIVSYPIEITQTPTRLTMLAELESQYRRIFLDGRQFPENYPTTRMGYSIGHWEGDTLIIETKLLSEMLPGRFPRSENTTVMERVTKLKRADVKAPANGFINNPTLDDNVLAFELTVTDPDLYSAPQKVTVYYQHIDDNSMLEYDCIVDIWQQALDAANAKGAE